MFTNLTGKHLISQLGSLTTPIKLNKCFSHKQHDKRSGLIIRFAPKVLLVIGLVSSQLTAKDHVSTLTAEQLQAETPALTKLAGSRHSIDSATALGIILSKEDVSQADKITAINEFVSTGRERVWKAAHIIATLPTAEELITSLVSHEELRNAGGAALASIITMRHLEAVQIEKFAPPQPTRKSTAGQACTPWSCS